MLLISRLITNKSWQPLPTNFYQTKKDCYQGNLSFTYLQFEFTLFNLI